MRHTQLTGDLQEQATLYAAGAMTDSERKEYVRHLEEDQCAVCLSEVNELQGAVSLLAFSTAPATPSPAVKERLMEQARSVAPPRAVPARPSIPWFLRYWTQLIPTGAAIAAVVVAFVLYSRLAQLEVEVNRYEKYVGTLTSPDVRVVDLAGQNANVGAKGRIFWDQSKKKWLFIARDLPRLSPDKTYQLWFVPTTGNPVSAAVFNTMTDGSVQAEIDVPPGITMLKAAAVTTEPAGGLPQPSGQFALLGAL
jgi:anti-sigma-K factor RskA